MAVIYEAKYGIGKLTVTEEAVVFQQPGVERKAIARSSIIGMDSTMKLVSFFGKGGMQHVTIRTVGGPFTFDVSAKIAKELMQVLGYA